MQVDNTTMNQVAVESVKEGKYFKKYRKPSLRQETSDKRSTVKKTRDDRLNYLTIVRDKIN